MKVHDDLRDVLPLLPMTELRPADMVRAENWVRRCTHEGVVFSLPLEIVDFGTCVEITWEDIGEDCGETFPAGQFVRVAKSPTAARAWNQLVTAHAVMTRLLSPEECVAKDRPEIIVLCGSTRFPDAWAEARFDLTLKGKIVLTIGCDTKSDEGLGVTAEQKVMLDELHKRKIDMADRVLVLNVGGYIGESTRSEIIYATALGLKIDYLEEFVEVAS